MSYFSKFLLYLSLGFFILSCSGNRSVSNSDYSKNIDDSPLIDGNKANIVTEELEEEVEELSPTNNPSGSKLLYRDHEYRSNIKTVQLYPKGDPMSFPVLFLNDGKQLELHFDDLDKEFHVYTYDIVHCNANWEPSGLVMQEYIEGFFNGFIEEYKYSFNTLFPYIHYQINIPNQDIRFTKSGNYLLKVYANNDPEDLILTRRFYVVDQRISIKSQAKLATLAKYRDYKQEIDFTLNLGSYSVIDPYADLSVVISQNRRLDNAIKDLKPLFVRTPELVYNYERENLFDGNNEFRFFDTKDLRYQAINVDGIQIIDGKTHVYILPDESRSYKQYFFQNDINGMRLIKRDDSNISDREADYIKTFFTLKANRKYEGGDIYVFGELSDWNFLPEFKMDYVEVEGEYRCTALIKQGYYNYSYVFLPNGESKGDMSVVEGTHSATENDYYFFVYHRQRGEIYDRLIGYSEISTGNNN